MSVPKQPLQVAPLDSSGPILFEKSSAPSRNLLPIAALHNFLISSDWRVDEWHGSSVA